jgi:hypothetical protein
MHSECTECRKCLTAVEMQEGSLCMRCELEYLRAYKKRHDEALQSLKGGPIHRSCKGYSVHRVGCVINF